MFKLMTCLLIVAWPALGFAQEEQAETVLPPAQGKAVFVTDAVLSGQDEGPAIRVMGASDGGEFFFSTEASPMMAYGDSFSMLGDPQIQKELELVEDQQAQLRELQASFAKRLTEHMNNVGTEGWRPGNGEALRKIIEEARQEQQSKMEQILLPHQLDRLKQVALQMQMRSRGDMETLTDQKIAEELGIDDEQKKRLKERAQEIKEELEAEIAELKKKAQQKLLRELTAEQRQQLEGMLGNEFDYKPVDFRSRLEKMRNRQERPPADDK